jgi:hypothetical protein
LARSWHLLDTETPRGAVTLTPRGGRPRLGAARISDQLDGAFDELAHRPQIRPPDAGRGRLYEIAGVNLFVWRQQVFALRTITPFRLNATHYTLDPSGRDVPLFQPGAESAAQAGRGSFESRFEEIPRAEWSPRAPIPCRRLNAATYRLEDDPTHPPAWAPLLGRLFRDTAAIVEQATAIGGIAIPDLLAASLTPDCPKANLLAGAATATPALDLAVARTPSEPSLAPEAVLGASLAGWADGAVLDPWVEALVDPVRGRVQLPSSPRPRSLQARRLHYGLFWPVGAGTHDRRRTVPVAAVAPTPMILTPAFATLSGDRVVADSRTYRPTTAAGVITVNADARLWALDRQRPYLLFTAAPRRRTIRLVASPPGPKTLEIDGLWLGIALRRAGLAAPTDLAELVLAGDWSRVTLRDVTLDPGGEQAVLPGRPPRRIPHVRLVIEGTVTELHIERCILGSLSERRGVPGGACSAAQVRVSDSVVIAHSSGPAIALATASLTLERTTVFGDVLGGQASISQTIIDGRVEVENAQDSCFRFSTAWSGGRIPAQYESVLFAAGLPRESFVSRRFGDPGLAQLSPACPITVSRGGENGTEMGVFNLALAPIKHDDLAAKLAEYAPVQARVQILPVT